MKILLVRPGRRKQAITLGEFMYGEPLGLESVFALLKEEHELKVLDLMVGKEDLLTICVSYRPDVIGFTSLCIDVPAVLDLAKQVKDHHPDVITMVGGTQTFLAPESFFVPQIDHVAEFTTKENLKTLCSYLQKKAQVPLIDGIRSQENHFEGTGVRGINDYIQPDRSCTDQYRKYYSYFGYRPCALLQTSRGCSSMCNFCQRWKIEGSQEKDEPLTEIIREIEKIKEPSIMIIDNNFLYHRERLENFCALLEERGIRKNFICYGSAQSIVQNETTMKRLAENGLKAVLVGYESFKDEELANYQKKSTRAINIAAGKILKNYHIDCWASFILHPDWTTQDFKEFRKYLKILRPEISSLTPLTPFPGSFLAKKYRDRTLYQKEDYDQWSYSLVSIAPGNMSLRRYYFEVLLSNFYVNLFMNNASYLVNKFGLCTLLRLLKGSFKFLLRYLRFMIKG